MRAIRPNVGDGLQCDRCGPNVAAELRTCRIEGRGLTRVGPRPEMRLCLPCIGALEAIGALVHIRRTSQELRASIAVVRPGMPFTIHPDVPTLPGETAERAPELLISVAQKAVEFVIDRRSHLSDAVRRQAVALLEAAIKRDSDRLVRAAAAAESLDRSREREEGRREAMRQAMAVELRSARSKRAQLNREIKAAEGKLAAREKALAPPQKRADLAAQLKRARDRLGVLREAYAKESTDWIMKTVSPIPGAYPDVPAGRLQPSKDGAGLPETSGIYFLWSDDTVEYVGQSIKLCNRVRIGHDRLRKDHLISFVAVESRDLDWAECWYIGALRPRLNFGSRAKHFLPLLPAEQ